MKKAVTKGPDAAGQEGQGPEGAADALEDAEGQAEAPGGATVAALTTGRPVPESQTWRVKEFCSSVTWEFP